METLPAIACVLAAGCYVPVLVAVTSEIQSDLVCMLAAKCGFGDDTSSTEKIIVCRESCSYWKVQKLEMFSPLAAYNLSSYDAWGHLVGWPFSCRALCRKASTRSFLLLVSCIVLGCIPRQTHLYTSTQKLHSNQSPACTQQAHDMT